jgi:molybdopterin-containing oxidoreductase family iron-sulfur binding subunit
VIERRTFLKTLGLAGSAAVVDSCAKRSTDELIPYFVSPDAVVAGVPAYYATTCRACPAGCGMIVKTLNGRITKAEGNPRHPIGRGRLCARGQAVVQSVYNPYRFRQPGVRDSRGVLQPASWDDAEQVFAAKLRDARGRGANRIAWIGRLETGPFDDLVSTWLTALGSTRRLAYETFDYHTIQAAADAAFGRAEIPQFDLDRAEFVLAFGAEFLETWISNVELTNAYARLRARRLHDPNGAFVWVSPRLSLTGLNADGWIPAPPGSEAAIAFAVASAMLADGLVDPSSAPDLPSLRAALDRFTPERIEQTTGIAAASIHAVARRFARRGASLALGGGANASGDKQAVALEVAVLLLNALNGNIGSTVTFGPSRALNRLATPQQIAELIEAMHTGNIDVLLVHHANPAYTLPPAGGFVAALQRVPFVVAFGSMQDETTDRAQLVLPDDHDLESWGTYAPRDGIAGSLQPAAPPLFDTRATADVLISAAQQIDSDVARAVGTTSWQQRLQDWWGPERDSIVHDGGRLETVASATPSVSLEDVSSIIASTSLPATDSTLTFIAYPTTQLFDGRHADVSWLEELPDPVNKTVWGNCVEIHPGTAARLGIGNDEEVEVASPHGRVTARARLHPGVHANAIAMAIGYGRTASMRFGAPRGANAIQLLGLSPDSAGAVWTTAGVNLRRTSGGRRLIVLQAESTAGPAEEPALAKIVRPDRVDERVSEAPKTVQFYPPHDHPEHRWGMAIDLNACTGCSACVVACYAENNVAVVGPELCAQGREMSWIRLEREAHDLKDADGIKAPGNVFLPMLCQQCDNAPCESVCPVFATYHNPEGLNAQVYVRCIGTRFCSNNCPYKVRRFNWARYPWTPPLEEQLNPDVTVRSVGVMEKCTFCVQRIQAGKIDAKRDQRGLRDGDIVPACAQTCPADAIVFGDLHDPNSRVSRLSQLARGYYALEELNTKPAITYLRRVVPGAPEHAG